MRSVGVTKKLEHKLNFDKYSIQTNVQWSIAGALIAILSNLTIFNISLARMVMPEYLRGFLDP